MSDGAMVLLVVAGLTLSGWIVALVFMKKAKRERLETERIRKSVEHLWQYENIHDADTRAKEMVRRAEEAAQQSARDVERTLALAKQAAAE